jgi:hypothetical protein
LNAFCRDYPASRLATWAAVPSLLFLAAAVRWIFTWQLNSVLAGTRIGSAMRHS